MTQCVYTLILSQADFSANAVLYAIMCALFNTEGVPHAWEGDFGKSPYIFEEDLP